MATHGSEFLFPEDVITFTQRKSIRPNTPLILYIDFALVIT